MTTKHPPSPPMTLGNMRRKALIFPNARASW